ncbi:DsbA family protein [Pseudomonas sp. SWRI92]|uniref:DsbA family protein n=1 Tax=Pseudomonas marvdashtae TaxID=2745500 RepID=A0A923FRY5_9PSED|nr:MULTISPECIES: DsbA family protein [Pseudomonas]MBC3375611.1 DsbA family protein [Pseudomonas sp. SWRI92]MBV4554746.1 DsbA family protein [Pseudomonas marvdashtae]
MAILHYIYDPLCGWCYGAKPLIQAARTVLPVVAHGGGMMTGANRQPVSAQLRNYVMPHDQRIAEYTGQPFGEAYFDGLLRDHSAVFDSTPPTAAVLAAEQLGGLGLELLERLQTGHYVEGRRIADHTVLLELAQSVGLESQAFQATMLTVDVQAHVQDSRALLARVGGQGFPTLALEQDGQYRVIDIGPWLGKPQAFVDWLKQIAPAAASGQSFEACGLDGCSL